MLHGCDRAAGLRGPNASAHVVSGSTPPVTVDMHWAVRVRTPPPHVLEQPSLQSDSCHSTVTAVTADALTYVDVLLPPQASTLQGALCNRLADVAVLTVTAAGEAAPS